MHFFSVPITNQEYRIDPIRSDDDDDFLNEEGDLSPEVFLEELVTLLVEENIVNVLPLDNISPVVINKFNLPLEKESTASLNLEEITAGIENKDLNIIVIERDQEIEDLYNQLQLQNIEFLVNEELNVESCVPKNAIKNPIATSSQVRLRRVQVVKIKVFLVLLSKCSILCQCLLLRNKEKDPIVI